MSKKPDPNSLIQTWTLTPAATFGSVVRAKGILLEIRARLPLATRKALDHDGKQLILTLPENSSREFHALSDTITRLLSDMENLPLIPREIEDILGISSTERHRWLNDRRLPSAGTRTVKLRGRARQITFHVFDPRMVEDLIDRGVIDEWREDDLAAAAENRRQAAWKAKLTRSLKKDRKPASATERKPDKAATSLAGWDDFDRDGLLR